MTSLDGIPGRAVVILGAFQVVEYDRCGSFWKIKWFSIINKKVNISYFFLKYTTKC